jgi:dienelactone hydrolase
MPTLFSQTMQRDTGILKGAAYEIIVPANWNKKLVLYAHGYVAPNSPNPTFRKNALASVFLDRGFAFARSAYQHDGWALPEGVDDTENLRQYFIKKYGKVDSTFITGQSMGGGITIASIEKYPKIYAGGLALCPLANRPYVQTKIAFDALITFNALFPDVLPKVSDIVSGKAPALFTGGMREMAQKSKEIAEKISIYPEKVAIFAKNYEIKVKDVPFCLLFMDGILRDVYKQSNGNPYDNTNTLYVNFPDDWELNQKVERIAATASADRLTKYDRTGSIDKPILMMHTSYDQLISPTALVNYDNLVHQAHKEQNLKVFYTNGQGHCNFTPQETATAFDALRSWSKTKQKPTKLAISNASQKPQTDTLCYEMRIYTANKGKLNDLLRRFRNHTTKIFENNGMTNVGYWTPLDNVDEKVYYVLSYPNRAARETSWKNFMADTTWQRVAKESEINGGLVGKVESIFLQTTDFSPNNMQGNSNGVWELRTYTTTPNNLGNLLTRFRDHTLKIFEKRGMTNRIYWTATDSAQGSDKMLYYMLTHASPAAAKASFDAMGKYRMATNKKRIGSERRGFAHLENRIGVFISYGFFKSEVKAVILQRNYVYGAIALYGVVCVYAKWRKHRCCHAILRRLNATA